MIGRIPLQFNNFNFKGKVASADFGIKFKRVFNDLSFSSGVAYNDSALLESNDIKVNLEWDLERFDFEDRGYYIDWVKKELMRAGTLYALDYNGKMIECDAVVTDINYQFEVNNPFINIDLNFKNISGKWRKTDIYNTFLVERCEKAYIYCNQCKEDCDGLTAISQCGNCDCGSCGCCDCTHTALCNIGDLSVFFGKCKSIDIVKDCTSGYNINGTIAKKGIELELDHTKTCTTLTFCSQTVLDTNDISIYLEGSWVKPSVTINSQTISLFGIYKNIKINSGNGSSCECYPYNSVISRRRNIITENPEFICNKDTYRTPFFNVKNGAKNVIQICGYAPLSKAYIKMTNYTI